MGNEIQTNSAQGRGLIAIIVLVEIRLPASGQSGVGGDVLEQQNDQQQADPTQGRHHRSGKDRVSHTCENPQDFNIADSDGVKNQVNDSGLTPKRSNPTENMMHK